MHTAAEIATKFLGSDAGKDDLIAEIEALVVEERLSARVACLAAPTATVLRKAGTMIDLLSSSKALLDLDADGVLVPHGLGGHGRKCLGWAVSEIERLRAEVAALRKRAGDGSSVEPIGCPTPGACSCPK